MKPVIHTAFDLSKRPYIHGCSWEKDYIKFYFQNQLVRVVKTPESYVYPMHLIVNNAVDPMYTDEITTPNSFQVFYVRAYLKKNTP